jgi:hypothetical protein
VFGPNVTDLDDERGCLRHRACATLLLIGGVAQMKLMRVLLPVVLSFVATILALAASRLFDRNAIEREFGPLSGEIDQVPSI